MNKNGELAPSGSNNDILKLVIILYIITNSLYNVFMPVQASVSKAN